jgi:teichuronic acid biosynthesis glycosyltransferase TuaC
MKILFISTTYPTPQRPSQGAFNQVLVAALSARHSIQVVAPVPWTQCKTPYGLSKAVRGPFRAAPALETTPKTTVYHPVYFYTPKCMRRSYGRWYGYSIAATIQRLMVDNNPDVVLSYWLHPDGHAANQVAKMCNVPSVVMSGGTDLRVLSQTRARQTPIRRVLQQADRAIVVSQELVPHAIHLGLEPSKIAVVRRGIDRECFSPGDRRAARQHLGMAESSIVLLWVGRFEPVKNPQLFLAAAQEWYRLWGERLKIRLIGAGSLLGELQRTIVRLGLRQVAELIPPMPQPQLANYYRAANLTVLTSDSEGIPNVLLESISCNTPFVATDVGGVSEIASVGLDRLVPANNWEQLAAQVIDGVQAAGVGTRTFLPSSPQQMATEVEHVLQSAIESRSADVGGVRSAEAA